ncbi:MAG TPA: gluconate 2-dehydrogenase subunit 3 family protein [Candidatus Acidoferrales bacterium]|nr:gluconate 2-dehydrogenase subunit 3 family protein [Candidatus Acidoferrales bacterium]
MEDKRAETQGPSRRSVLIGTVSGLSSIWLATHWPGILAAQEHAHTVAASGQPGTFAFFSPDQAVEIESVAAQIIPKDDTPGAREAGTIYFIDRILTSFEQDKQVTYAEGLKDLQAKTQELFPNVDKFSRLDSGQQVQLLTSIEKSAFFTLVRMHTIVGFFANPEYGGNQDRIGWNLIGFEDKFDWKPPFGHYDRDAHEQS